MIDYVIQPPAIPAVDVTASSARFALRRIFCIGRNHAAHARELGKDPDRKPTFFFSKPAGVGPLLPGDVRVVEIDGPGRLTTTIGARELPGQSA